MTVTILKNNDFLQSKWSGGSTTQLYISPPHATYADRNFDVRLSTASVEATHSIFTSLPGVSRKLMILEGEIEINHENEYKKVLKPFDVDAFNGEWASTASGTCTDFNVMTRGNTRSELSSFRLDADGEVLLNISDTWRTLCLFLVEGRLEVTIGKQKHRLEQGNLMVIDALNIRTFPVQALSRCRVVSTCLGED